MRIPALNSCVFDDYTMRDYGIYKVGKTYEVRTADCSKGSDHNLCYSDGIHTVEAKCATLKEAKWAFGDVEARYILEKHASRR